MSRLITATGMALLSIGVVAGVSAEPAGTAGQVVLDEAAAATAGSVCADDDAARTGRPKEKTKTATNGRHRGPKGGGRDKIDTGKAAGAPDAECSAKATKGRGRPRERDKIMTN